MDKQVYVEELQRYQIQLLDQLYKDVSSEEMRELNQKYDLTVEALLKELGENSHCNSIDCSLYELFHSVKDESFHRGASYKFVRQWYLDKQ